MARLSAYHAKRNFGITAEPRGAIARTKRKTHRFVIQKHDATRLHYDFRLELDGVYKSWAVTKVPSLDPAVKRLAVEVEDHPLDYGTFEGTIPQGEYGGGTVQLWDKGRWQSQGDKPSRADLAKGQLKFVLAGERLKGGWALIRLRDEEKRPGRKIRHNWLLIKEKDEFARPGKPDLLLREVKSIKTGRTLGEIAAGAKPHEIKHAAKAAKRAPTRKAALKKKTTGTRKAARIGKKSRAR